ncbi:MAG: GTP-binding protein [Candidatus Hodarchaeota archaeon]
MPAKTPKQLTRVLKLMRNLKNIRNASLIGHVDHGKTTLSDSLLANAGLLSPQLAGTALLLDFLDEEQERGITMKTANISLVFDYEGEEILVNLVDTPGHVDFSGKVTRALRLIDSAIVVVDAVEGVMIQTEHVLMQALENAVRPLLYINKVDRLIKELNLDAKEIQQKFKDIIDNFNVLIENNAKQDFMKDWKVSLTNETVAFGSALYGWGATLSQFQKVFEKFNAIMEVYDEEGDKDGRLSDLKEKLPIHEAILQMVVKNGPNPVEAQAYRIPFIWHGDMKTDLGKSLEGCKVEGPAVVFTSKVQVKNKQMIATGRLFSGTINRGTEVILVNEGAKEKLNDIGVFMGHRMLAVEEVPAGNVVAIKGLKDIKSGETLLDADYAGDAGGDLSFEKMIYLMEPVVTVSIEPEKLVNLKKLQEFMLTKLIEDPNLKMEVSEQTGEILLSGIGPLHLEVICNDISKEGIPVIVSEPITMFHESIDGKTGVLSEESSNEKNEVTLKIARVASGDIDILKNMSIQYDKNGLSKRSLSLLKESGCSLEPVQVENLLEITSDLNMITCPARANPQNPPISRKDEMLVISAIKSILRHGPLVKESIRELIISIESLKLSSSSDEKDISEIIPMFRRAMFDLMRQSGVQLLEPIFESTIYGSVENIGKLTSLISQYNGKIENIDQEGSTVNIRAFFPVRSSFGLIESAKNLTSGRAVFQNVFHGFEKVPSNEINSIVDELKAKKGLV